MMKKYLLIFITILSIFVLVGCVLKEENTIQMVASSNTSFSYHLLDDNINPKITYDKYSRRDFEGGYDYMTSDGSEIQRFTQIDKYGTNPVMSYLRISHNGHMDHTLFGIKLGSSTVVYKSDVLGIDKTFSFVDYLYTLGFKINYGKQYINSRYESINDIHVYWVYLVKDEVFINIATEVGENMPLVAFEIGLNIDEVNDKLKMEKEGFEISIDEGIEYLYNQVIGLNKTYQSGYLIKLKVKKNELELTPSLYINDEFVKKFDSSHSDLKYNYEVVFFMFNNAVKIDIRYLE